MSTNDSSADPHSCDPHSIDPHSDVGALVPEQENLGFLLADNVRLTRRIAGHYFEQYQMTLSQAKALLGVRRWQGIRQVDLADFMDIQPISLARLLDQLAQQGWIERRPDPKDRRAFQLFLTPAAAPIVKMITAASAEFQQRALAGLSAEQQQALFVGLNKVHENLMAMSKGQQTRDESEVSEK
ncbi:MarR family winged helix-turn-helix transcriptional regulator [Cellvibrio sp. pealriver]|uniref:MarR family winged helix-turn-helix transcriptional regulator n=1 Tax=Cellvibrio sp. pealriver TaxID=1622269 RepID=UPI0009E4AC2D|nr:MarR family transcriptional regulator [Cellvibrio sp. pealriver]